MSLTLLCTSPASHASTRTTSPIWSTQLGAFETYDVPSYIHARHNRLHPPHKVCLKGWLATPRRRGVSSLNMQLRKGLEHEVVPGVVESLAVQSDSKYEKDLHTGIEGEAMLKQLSTSATSVPTKAPTISSGKNVVNSWPMNMNRAIERT